MLKYVQTPVRTLTLLLLLGASAPADSAGQDWSTMRLSYDAPAAAWNQALPVGNGRLGAMVLGGVAEERLVLNEETLWTGGPYDPTREGGAEALPEIQRLLFAGDVERAHDLFGRTMMGIPYEQQKYQPLGDLRIWFPGHEEPENYSRVLDMDAAEVRVQYEIDGVRYTRTVFSSAPDQVMVVRLEADQPGAISFDARLFGMRNTAHSNYDTAYFTIDGVAPNHLTLSGKNSDYLGIEGQLTYEAKVTTATEGGTVEVDYRTLRVRDADSATLVIAAATSFVDYQTVDADPAARVEEALAGVAGTDYAMLRARHSAEHREWFRRVWIEGTAAAAETPESAARNAWQPDLESIPLDQRLARLDSLPDPNLLALTYQLGRYMLIASSRPGTQAANLQGIWNESANPSWDSKYTVNINLPMNYWPAESAGLSELAGPLYELISDVSESGRSVAEKHWGARGWVLHQNTDLWRAAAPMDGPSWGAWPVGGAWLTTHLFERNRFAPDQDFVSTWYPVVRDQARFLADILVEHPENGWLVTAPSNSPENFPAFPGNGRYYDETSALFLRGRMMQPGPTMDNHIVRALFDGYLDWASELGVDAEMQAEVRAKMDRLPPNQIGSNGQLQEWITDWDELEPGHRHVSHLWGVYPGSEIEPEATPEMAAAAAVTLDRRGTGGCGWSYAHKAGARARLHQGAEAEEQLVRYLADNVLTNLFSRCGSTLQVDGTFGMTGAIGEMLVQSDSPPTEGADVRIELLPALPPQWTDGRLSGVRAQGGFTLDIAWEGGELTELMVHSVSGNSLALAGFGDAAVITGSGAGVRAATRPSREGGTSDLVFATTAGQSYQLVMPRR